MEAMIVWIVLIILFVVIEIITIGLTSIWFAGGALTALFAAGLGAGISVQITLFFLVSLVLLCFTRPWALKYFKPHLVKTNYEEHIGKNVCLTEPVDNRKGTGRAVINGQEWNARAYQEDAVFDAGMIVKVQEIRGVTMYVTQSSDMPVGKKTE